ncbi:susd and RagB outer membrane lipoprotein [Elysia marginata]|uniref:Susd and RagB outer membrane lipoprotein n=1 Tax=Elysia marginata TaxID=1093978 RepID=A0AAV4F032_9GAST|nr:susd and RagB outer membrane lipoprotein [Elysia marginata]
MQVIHSLFTDIYANYFATTAKNFDSDQFTLVGKWINIGWESWYSECSPQIKLVEDFTKGKYPIENAIMKVWRVYHYSRITDLWGPIPYSKFGNEKTSVPYDSQQDIYKDFFKTLSAATNVLNAHKDKTSAFGSNDIIYKGDVAKWLKFANSLHLRLAMRIRYADKTMAKQEAEKAVRPENGGVMESNKDNAFVKTETFYKNPYNTITQWGEFRMSADMESILKGYKDPRVQNYFDKAKPLDPEKNDDTTFIDRKDDPSGLEFDYEGFRNGQTKTEKAKKLNKYSDMAAPYRVNGGEGPSWPVMRFAEVNFLKAEGALMGWNMAGGTTEDFYNQGIKASLLEYGYEDKDLSGAQYTISTSLPLGFQSNNSNDAVSKVPVKFEGNDKEKKLEQIITQKWIALFPNSEEAYAERRRTGYPKLYDRAHSLNPDIPKDRIPRRLPYASSEKTNNKKAVDIAINKYLRGSDKGSTKLWWDQK